MASVILEVLPYAIGVFASPLPVIIAIVMLFTSQPRPTSVTYVVTWIAGLTAVTVLLTLLASRLPGGQGDGGWGAWLRVVLGVVLIAAAARMWLGRSQDETPAWLAALIDAGPREAVRYGLLMSAANPKELLMAVAAALVVGGSDVGPAAAAGALAVFILVGAASVAAPLAVFLWGGQSTLEALARAREWLQRNSVAVAAGVLGAIGLFLLAGGLLKV